MMPYEVENNPKTVHLKFYTCIHKTKHSDSEQIGVEVLWVADIKILDCTGLLGI